MFEKERVRAKVVQARHFSLTRVTPHAWHVRHDLIKFHIDGLKERRESPFKPGAFACPSSPFCATSIEN